MSLFEAAFLGIIQGLTEFLPVSSSGHLVLFSQLLGVQEPTLNFEIIVHLGTLLAVFVVFWQDILLLIKSFFKLVANPKQAKKLVQTDEGCALLWMLILATLPVVLFALLFKSKIESLFLNSMFVGFALIITGTILYFSQRQPKQGKDLQEASSTDALLIGLGQSIAVLPGISRSGTTIAVGLVRGMKRETAARFSFLLSIPAILGALVFSIGDFIGGTSALSGSILFTGLVASALTGYFAIHLLLEIVKKGKLVWFSYYTWFIGALVIILSLV